MIYKGSFSSHRIVYSATPRDKIPQPYLKKKKKINNVFKHRNYGP